MLVLLVSTPVAPLGHPVAGGVTAIVAAMARVLSQRGHAVGAVAPRGSVRLPGITELVDVPGRLQAPAQGRLPQGRAALGGPRHPEPSVLTAMLAAAAGRDADVVIHLAYDVEAIEAVAAASRPAGILLTMPSLGDAAFDAAVAGQAASHAETVATLSRAQGASFGLREPRVLSIGLDMDAHPFGGEPAWRLVWAARIAAEKRPAEALAVAELTGMPIDVCGAVEDATVWAAAQAAHPGAELRYHGHLATPDLLAVLARAAVFLQTSGDFEALGISACQALACGTPVAAYPGGSAGEVVEAGAGVLARTGDPGALASAVAAAATLDRHVVRRSAERRFSLPAFGDRLERWLLELR